MSVKSEVTEQAVSKGYPRIMKSKQGRYVLFHRSGCGVIVADESSLPYKVGIYKTDWVMTQFVDFVGQVALLETGE